MNRLIPCALALACFSISGCASEAPVNEPGSKTATGGSGDAKTAAAKKDDAKKDAGDKVDDATKKVADAGKKAADTAKKADGNWSDGDTIPSGMDGVPAIKILKVHKNGSGERCGTGKQASLRYKAMKADGTVLDPGTRPFTFTVGQGQAIRGWDVVVAKMRIGDSFTIWLPKQLAYGDQQGDLKFDMELLSVR